MGLIKSGVQDGIAYFRVINMPRTEGPSVCPAQQCRMLSLGFESRTEILKSGGG
jgi:hypothetical protein